MALNLSPLAALQSRQPNIQQAVNKMQSVGYTPPPVQSPAAGGLAQMGAYTSPYGTSSPDIYQNLIPTTNPDSWLSRSLFQSKMPGAITDQMVNPYGERADQLGGALGLARMKGDYAQNNNIKLPTKEEVDAAIAQNNAQLTSRANDLYNNRFVFDPSKAVAYNPNLPALTHTKNTGGWTWMKDATNKDAYLSAITSDLYSDIRNASGGVGNKGIGADEANLMMAARLHDVGISDLDQVGYTAGPNGQAIFYDKMTGQAIPSELKGTNTGEGMQKIFLTIDKQGRVVPKNAWEDTSNAKDFMAPVAIAAALAAPWAVGAMAPVLGGGAATLGSTIGAGALYGAGTGGLQAAIGGGNIGKGILTGGLTGAIGAGIGGGANQFNAASALNVPQSMQGFTNAALSGGLRGVAGAAINGGDIGRALVSGALGGGIGNLATGALTDIIGNPNAKGFDIGNMLAGMGGGYLGSQSANYLTNALMGKGPNASTTAGTMGALGMGNSVAQAARGRRFNISGLDKAKQQRIKEGYGKLQSYGVPGTEEPVEWA